MPFANGATMSTAPETIQVRTHRVACDGSGEAVPPALGHPKVWLEIDESGFVECGYCDRRYVLAGGPADMGKTKTAG
jgi:NADH dehydrogenase (ubiquinone) Fe-S protein 6